MQLSLHLTTVELYVSAKLYASHSLQFIIDRPFAGKITRRRTLFLRKIADCRNSFTFSYSIILREKFGSRNEWISRK